MAAVLVVILKGAKGTTEQVRFQDVTYQQFPHTLLITDRYGNTRASFARDTVKGWWFEPTSQFSQPLPRSRAA